MIVAILGVVVLKNNFKMVNLLLPLVVAVYVTEYN